MIQIQAKIHDLNTLEFKVGYIARRKLPVSTFHMNTWIFVPDSLGINSKTYPKESFYRDIRSYIRLMTPSYLLSDLAKPDVLPYQLLLDACSKMCFDATQAHVSVYESEIKMYASIVKSAVRDACIYVKNNANDSDRVLLCSQILSDIQSILFHYRNIRNIASIDKLSKQYVKYFNYGDEFISNVVEQHVFQLRALLDTQFPSDAKKLRKSFIDLLDQELLHKKKMQYNWVKHDSKENNKQFVYHASMLKKYIESDLYLRAHSRKNTFFLEQIAFSFAAGISMVFATVISFSFQQTYGNFTLPFFIALVISYMFKDRIKELVRYYFTNKLGSHFFDNRISIRVNDKQIGFCKEGFDYESNGKLPTHVKEKRDRTSTLKVNRRVDEQVFLYKKYLYLKRKGVKGASPYPIVGVNDIIRYNLSEFMRKMDNSKVPIYANLGNGAYELIKGEKVYFLNFVIECKYEGQVEYRRYRVCLNQKGLKSVQAIN